MSSNYHKFCIKRFDWSIRVVVLLGNALLIRSSQKRSPGEDRKAFPEEESEGIPTGVIKETSGPKER